MSAAQSSSVRPSDRVQAFKALLRTLREMSRKPSGLVGMALVGLHLLVALTSPWLAPFDYKAVSASLMLIPPDSVHWLGTDHLGRDVFTRTMMGGREALSVTLLATPLAMLWGGFLGIYLGLVGGRTDEWVMRGIDALLALPWILKMLLLIVTFGAGLGVLVPGLAFFYGVPIVRVARAASQSVVAKDYIRAARARGHSRWSIMRKEMLPNVLDALLVEGAMRWSWMLLAFSSLSFLGFGVTPPTPDWGLMVADSRTYLPIAPWVGMAPIVALSSLIIGINLCADALAKTLGIDREQKAPV